MKHFSTCVNPTTAFIKAKEDEMKSNYYEIK